MFEKPNTQRFVAPGVFRDVTCVIKQNAGFHYGVLDERKHQSAVPEAGVPN